MCASNGTDFNWLYLLIRTYLSTYCLSCLLAENEEVGFSNSWVIFASNISDWIKFLSPIQTSKILNSIILQATLQTFIFYSWRTVDKSNKLSSKPIIGRQNMYTVDKVLLLHIKHS